MNNESNLVNTVTNECDNTGKRFDLRRIQQLELLDIWKKRKKKQILIFMVFVLDATIFNSFS